MIKEILWYSATQFVTGSPSLTVSYSTATHPAVEIASTDTDPANLKWIYLGLVLPAGCVVTGIRICYQLSDSGSFISQVQLQEMQTPDLTTVAHDDTAELRELSPACYISTVPAYRPTGAVTLALRLSFGDVGHRITIGSIGVDLLKCDSHVVNVTCYGAKGDGKSGKGSIAAGSPNLLCQSDVFSAGDEGKIIYIAGAGNEQHWGLQTRIRSVEDQRRVTLDTPAVVEVADADVIWGTDDGTAVRSAIEAAGSAGARLYFPARIYMFVKDDVGLPLTGIPYISAHGARLVGARCTSASSFVWEGGTVHVDYVAASIVPVFRVQTSNSRLVDVEIINAAGYTGIEISGLYSFDGDRVTGAKPVQNVRLDRVTVNGRSGVTIREAKHISISNSYFSGSDDGIAIKALFDDTEHIVITDCMFDGQATMIGIGSEIYEPYAVRNVVMSNCVANNVAMPIYIKPAKVRDEKVVERRGIVENVIISNIAIHDAEGMALTRAVYLKASHGGRIRDVSLSNINCRARFSGNAGEAYFVYVLLDQKGAPDVGTAVEGLTIRDCVFHDIYNGACRGDRTPGLPAQTGVIMTLNNARAEDVTIENVYINGTNATAMSINEIDRLVVRGVILNNTNLRTGNLDTIGIDGSAIIKNVVIDSPLANSGITVEHALIAEQVMSVFGTYGAGTNVTIPVFVAPCRCCVFAIELINAKPIALDTANFSSFTVKNTDIVVATGDTTPQGEILDPPGLGGFRSRFKLGMSRSNKMVENGAVLVLEKSDMRNGQPTNEMRVIITFIPLNSFTTI